MSNDPQWRTLGVMAEAMSTHPNPVAVMINHKKDTRELSFQFGILKGGRVQPVRFWNESMMFGLAALTKYLGAAASLQMLTGKGVTADLLKKVADETPQLRWVEEYVPSGRKKRASMTLGERAIRRRA